MALMHAHSMKPTRNPVARTLGIAINSSDSGYSAATVLVRDTTNLWVYSIPGLISFIPSPQHITCCASTASEASLLDALVRRQTTHSQALAAPRPAKRAC